MGIRLRRVPHALWDAGLPPRLRRGARETPCRRRASDGSGHLFPRMSSILLSLGLHVPSDPAQSQARAHVAGPSAKTPEGAPETGRVAQSSPRGERIAAKAPDFLSDMSAK